MTPDLTVDQPVSLSLAPYTGTWGFDEAAHLMRRTMFGATFQQIESAVTDGMATTVSNLLNITPVNPPLAYDTDETVAAFGTTWVNSVYQGPDTQPNENARYRSLAAWTMQRLNTNTVDITEKICLFWQNHFAVEAVFDSRASYNYFELIRTHALGNFKQLIKDMTIDPAMLLFLNGATNNVYSPNENFSRELLELYTLGKGDQIGPGDYSTYTEADVAAGAKILTGWTVDGLRSTTLTSPVGYFIPTFHDNSTKVMSSHFGNAQITGNGANEYSDYIDLIFQQASCSTFICQKLYRYFVNYDLTPSVMTTVIADMAQTLVTNNYNILPVLDELFKSQHFYDVAVRGSLIKSPIESTFSWFNTSNSVPNVDLVTDYTMYLNLFYIAGTLGQNYLTPPSVGGWLAYYQEPSFSQLWLNSTYLKQRFDIATYLTQYNGIDVNGNFYKIDALNVVNGLSLPPSAPDVIDDLCALYCPKNVDAAAKLALKYILTNGLPDFEWTLQYNDYTGNVGNPTYEDPVRIRVELVLSRIFKMAEFQTI